MTANGRELVSNMVVIKIITFSYAIQGCVCTGWVCTRYKTMPMWEEQIKYYLQVCYNAMSVSFLSFEWGDLETMDTVESFTDVLVQSTHDIVIHCAHEDYRQDYFAFRGTSPRLFMSIG